MSSSQPAPIQVVAAALTDDHERILLAQRPPGKHMAGSWEFPGGKLEAGEPALHGLARELREELGIELLPGPHRPLRRIRHAYSDRIVEVQAWLVSDYYGEIRGLDGQALRWCHRSDLSTAELLPADTPIVRSLALPAHLTQLITDCYSMGKRMDSRQVGFFCEDVHAAREAEVEGVDFVAITRRLDDQDLMALCSMVNVPVYAMAMPMNVAWELGATGTHSL